MAEKVEIEIPGIGLIEAKNAATEATLLEILDVMKATQKDANKNAKDKSKGGSGSNGTGRADAANMAAFNKEQQSAGKSFSILGAAARGVGLAFNTVGKTAGIAVGGFNRMAGGAAMAAGATVTFGQKALAAGESMTDLIDRMANVGDSTERAADALRVIPGVGGVLAGVLGTVAGQIEKSVAAYQTSASVGATFNGSVQDMSRAASGAGMTLDQFANLIKSNAENLIYLGGTTESGAKAFAGLAKELQGSGAGAELQRLGFTTEQINSGMARYIGILGKTGALSGMTTSQIAAASGSYLKELDGLAKITGQTREEKQKEQDALMKDAQVRAAMAGMDAESQKQMMNYITSFPKEQQSAIKDMIATGNVTSEEAIKLQSMLPGVAEQTMQFGRTMQAGGKINADQMNSARNNAIREAKDSVMRNKARGMYDKEAGEAYVGAANLAAMEIDGLSKAMGEQGKATEKANLAENLTKAKQRLAEFSNSFQMALANSGMLDTLMNVFQTLGNFVLSVIVPVFKVFAEALNTVIPIVTAFLIPAFKMLGELVSNTIMPAFQVLGAWVKDGLMPIFTSLWGTVSTVVTSLTSLVGGVMGTVSVVEDIFEPALYAISDFIEDNLVPALATLAVVAIPAVVAKMATMATMAMSMLGTIANFIALNLPMIGFTIAVGAMVYLFKKFGVDLGVVTDALKWAGSWISTLFLKLQYGIYSLLNKIPGMRGDFDNDLKSISEQMTDNEEDRAKLEEDMAKRRQDNLKKEEDKANSRANRDEKRAERRDKREKDAIKNKENAELGAIDKKEEREKAAAAEAKGATVDKSDPIQMLKTYASQQKSAFTQEAKALDDKDKARSDLALASQEYAKAVEQNGKATNDMERKAAEERMKAAEERVSKATKANEAANEAVNKSKERMALAKQGKDPGAVAAGSPTTAAATTTAAPSASGTPTVDKAAVTEGVGNLYQQTQDAINKGIKYGFGSKDLKTGAIDCSGWIANINTNMMNSINKEAGKEVYGKEAKKAFQGSAADIIKNVSSAGGGMLEGSAAIRSQLKEGMLIGEDNGAKGFDAGRHKGIDHITQTVKDPKTGKLMISESQGGKGVTMTDPEEYFKRKEAKGVKLFGTDMTAMAKGADGRTTAPPSAMASVPAPGVDASGRATAATDPRLQRPAANTTTEPRREETLQSLIRDGITPTTMAFQELINKGIKPFQSIMSSGIQIKTPLNPVAPEDSLSPGEEIISSLKSEQMRMMAEAEKRGPDRIQMPNLLDITKMAEAVQPKDVKSSAAFEAPKSEIIAQAEKAAAEKAELEKQQAEFRETLKQQEAMAMSGPKTQEGPLSGSSDLNTALAELIAIGKRTAELNEKQLSVQSSLSGDLFA